MSHNFWQHFEYFAKPRRNMQVFMGLLLFQGRCKTIKKKNPTTSSNWRIDAEMYVNSSQYLRFLQGRIFIKSFTIQKHHWPATVPHVKKYLILSNLIMLCVIHTYVNWLTSVAFPLNWRLQNRRYQKLPELRNYHVLVVITSAWLQHIPRSSTSHAIHTCFQSAF